ncbi:MAG: hypothetical protein BWZ02_01075 [Lentisphaerae bacterium ADurb.BinA184]|nr:MAG: hypothetical protein BWZ02_01075 [Lentisphaerae bacterium ADurb.BinA184]
MLRDVKQLLHTAAYHPQEVENFLDLKNKSFLAFDPELGYTQTDYIFRDGMDETLSEYRYETGGQRRMVNYADRPCRLNTYGDSYTQCAQVSDGETWQEILAAHFREPIRNFGVGGYGVYQAYRRLMRTEVQKELAAKFLILNIWDDDHMRNIDAARWIRVGWMCRDLPRGGGKDAYPVHGFPWAHMRFDTAKGTFVELPGLCKRAADLRKLVGKDAYYETFKDDPVAHLYCLVEGGEAPVAEAEKVAEAFGIKVNLRSAKTRQKDARRLWKAYGIRSSQWIVETLSGWCAKNRRKLLVLLSYDVPQVQEYLTKGTRFDDEMLAFLDKGGYTYVDTLAKAGEEFKAYRLPVNGFLERFYVSRAGAQVFGHYTPAGNFWFANAVRKDIVAWLDPKPPAYH